MASSQTDKSFGDWQKSGFEPTSLPSWVEENNEVSSWMLRALHIDRVRGVRALMYHLDREDCLPIARDYVENEWVLDLIINRIKDPEVLDLFVLLAECSFCRDLFMDHLICRIVEGPHSQAFARVLNDRLPQDLLQRTAQTLAKLGFPEILEEQLLLRHWTVALGYLQLLSDNQYTQLCDDIDLHCNRDLLARWLSHDAPISHAPLPKAPAQFYDASSFWRWTYERLAFNALDDGACDWKKLEDRSIDLFNWWNAIQRAKKEPINVNLTITNMRTLDLDEDFVTPQFRVRYDQHLKDPHDLLSQLKSRAACIDPIYGRSASAARVALRSDVDKTAVLSRLEPIEVLQSKEIVRYLYLYGSDKSTLNIETAIRLASFQNTGARYDLVTFNSNSSFELVARLLVRNFAPLCKLTASPMKNNKLGLYIS